MSFSSIMNDWSRANANELQMVMNVISFRTKCITKLDMEFISNRTKSLGFLSRLGSSVFATLGRIFGVPCRWG